MAPTLTSTTFGSVIEATVAEQRDVTWELSSKLAVRGHGTLDLVDFGIASGGMPDQSEMGRSRLVRAVGDVLNNPWEQVAIDKIESTMKVKYERDLWHLRGVELLHDVVEAGERARVRVHLVPYDGKEFVREFEIPIPPELAGTEAEIEVVPGYDVLPDLAAPTTLAELLANETRRSLLPKGIVLQIKLPTQGVVFQGELAPRLPSFAFDALRPFHSDTGAEAVPSYVRTLHPVEHYVDGRDKVKVKVRRALR
jgi:hypothetical protein